MKKIHNRILALVLLAFSSITSAQMQVESLSNTTSEKNISVGDPQQNFMEFTQKYRDQFLAPAWNRFKNNQVGKLIGEQIDTQTLSTTSFLVGILGAPSEGVTHFWEVLIRSISGLILAGDSMESEEILNQDYILVILFEKISKPLTNIVEGVFKKFATLESFIAPVNRVQTYEIIELAAPKIAKTILILVSFILLLRIRKMIFKNHKSAAEIRRMRARRVRQYRG